MSYDPRIDRWIFQSIHKHFVAQQKDWKLYIEGEIRDTNQATEWVELRIDGPFSRQLGPTNWFARIEVNVLISVSTHTDLYAPQRISGEVAQILAMPIEIKKYGTELEDTQEHFSCLKLEQGARDVGIVTSNFGQANPKIPITQMTVEAHYSLEFSS